MCGTFYPKQADEIAQGYKNVMIQYKSYPETLNDLAELHQNCNSNLSQIFNNEQQDLLGSIKEVDHI